MNRVWIVERATWECMKLLAIEKRWKWQTNSEKKARQKREKIEKKKFIRIYTTKTWLRGKCNKVCNNSF